MHKPLHPEIETDDMTGLAVTITMVPMSAESTLNHVFCHKLNSYRHEEYNENECKRSRKEEKIGSFEISYLQTKVLFGIYN